MPQNLEAIAKKHGKTMAEAEKLWKEAKAAAEKQNKKGDWAYVMGIFSKMMGAK